MTEEELECADRLVEVGSGYPAVLEPEEIFAYHPVVIAAGRLAGTLQKCFQVREVYTLGLHTVAPDPEFACHRAERPTGPGLRPALRSAARRVATQSTRR